MANDAIDRHLPLHPLEFRILMALLDGASYGTRIVAFVEAAEQSGPPLYAANLYRRIRDLLNDGLVEAAPTPPEADTRRSYVRLTPTGRAVAHAEARRLEELVADAARHRLLGES